MGAAYDAGGCGEDRSGICRIIKNPRLEGLGLRETLNNYNMRAAMYFVRRPLSAHESSRVHINTT